MCPGAFAGATRNPSSNARIAGSQAEERFLTLLGMTETEPFLNKL